MGPLDSPRLEAFAASLGAPWRAEKTWFGYKLRRGDARWPFVDLFATEYDAAAAAIRYASPVARETWPEEWWRVDELYPLRPVAFGGDRRSSLRPPAPFDAARHLARAFGPDWRRVARTPVWDHRRDRWYDDARRGGAAVDVALTRADVVPLGHRSLAKAGTAVEDDAPPPPPTIGDALARLGVVDPPAGACSEKE